MVRIWKMNALKNTESDNHYHIAVSGNPHAALSIFMHVCCAWGKRSPQMFINRKMIYV